MVLKRDVLSVNKGKNEDDFQNYRLKNYEEKQVVLKSSSTKRHD